MSRQTSLYQKAHKTPIIEQLREHFVFLSAVEYGGRNLAGRHLEELSTRASRLLCSIECAYDMDLACTPASQPFHAYVYTEMAKLGGDIEDSTKAALWLIGAVNRAASDDKEQLFLVDDELLAPDDVT